MSDEIRAEIAAKAKALCHYPNGPSSINSCCPGIGRCEMGAAIAEIALLNAACDAYLKNEMLRSMRHGRILVGIERRNARQRRALVKLYQRRHDKNAEIARLRAAQSARIAELEAALQDIVSGRYSNVLLPTHPPQDPAVVRARAALEGGKDE